MAKLYAGTRSGYEYGFSHVATASRTWSAIDDMKLPLAKFQYPAVWQKVAGRDSGSIIHTMRCQKIGEQRE